VIFVLEGHYEENVLLTRDVEIRGRGEVEWTGQEGRSIVEVRAGVVVLANLSITGGVAPAGAGVSNAGSLTLDHVTVNANLAIGDGPRGAGIANSGDLVLLSSAVERNVITIGQDSTMVTPRVLRGAGIYSKGGSVRLSDSKLQGNGISEQDSTAVVLLGGGLYADEARVVIEAESFISGNFLNVTGGFNSIAADGAGIYQVAGELRVTDSHLVANRVQMSTFASASGRGGALFFQAGGPPLSGQAVRIEASEVEGNEIVLDGRSPQAMGAGIFLMGSAVELNVSSTTIRNNAVSARSLAEADSSVGGGGIAIDARSSATLNIQDSVVNDNSALTQDGDARGAGIYAACRSGGAVTRLLFERSAAVANRTLGGSARGGFAFLSSEGGGAQNHASVRNSTVVANVSRGEREGVGGGIFLSSNGGSALGRLELSNATLVRNDASSTGGAFQLEAEGGAATHGIGIRSSIVWGNLGQNDAACPSGSLIDAGGNSIVGTFGCAFAPGLIGFITVDPRLGQPSEDLNQVLMPLPGSPAIDLGDPSGCKDERGALLFTDQIGTPRPQGLRCDAGAIEAPSTN
jgi:hypothetical protein